MSVVLRLIVCTLAFHMLTFLVKATNRQAKIDWHFEVHSWKALADCRGLQGEVKSHLN